MSSFPSGAVIFPVRDKDDFTQLLEIRPTGMDFALAGGNQR